MARNQAPGESEKRLGPPSNSRSAIRKKERIKNLARADQRGDGFEGQHRSRGGVRLLLLDGPGQFRS